ncbi:uncharacterized protein Fot_53168 [Forsythia ovata]|uniref:C2 domain-containing protein n=1 Tax=Forsythia ovata TaxID=205694 RepID=A0ABD1PI13_9LAMI
MERHPLFTHSARYLPQVDTSLSLVVSGGKRTVLFPSSATITPTVVAANMAILKPFQLLEINIISAQDLEPVSRKMKTYAKAWVHSDRKLSSCVDNKGHSNPTWNDKFVFRVDEEFLRRDASAVVIEIYAVNWFRDTFVGTVRVLVGNLIPPPSRQHHNRHHFGMRFVALQVRRKSGRPQGILNIGVALLDSSMRSMPLYKQLDASAVGIRDLMEESNLHNQPPNLKPVLQRSKSERSDRLTFDTFSVANSSLVAIPGQRENGSCILSVSEIVDPFEGKKMKGKASSVISGAELRDKSKQKGKKGKASSVVSDSIFSKQSSVYAKNVNQDLKTKTQKNKDEFKKIKSKQGEENKVFDEMPVRDGKKYLAEKPPIPKANGYGYGATKGSMPNSKVVPFKASSILSDSEVGPSPSEVAAAMAAREKKYPLDDRESSILSGWSLDESVEGPMSKLERWRKELPPIYDRGFSTSSLSSTGQRVQRRNDRGGNGLFSCFGVVCGYECQCICGQPPEKSSHNTRFYSPSIGTPGRPYL